MSRSTEHRRRCWPSHLLFGALACLLALGAACIYEPQRLTVAADTGVTFGVTTQGPHSGLEVAWIARLGDEEENGSFALGNVGGAVTRHEMANGERVTHPLSPGVWTFWLDVTDAAGALRGSRCVTQHEIHEEQVIDVVFVEGSTCSGSSGGSSRPSQDLIAFYSFEEGAGSKVWDLSNFGEPLDLTIDPEVALWLGDEGYGRGLYFDFATSGDRNRIPARSGVPATKIKEAVAAAGQLTLEVWLQPVDDQQAGPARVLTSSLGVASRNLTLGQQAEHWIVRLRTDQNPSATSPQLESDAGSAHAALQHVVYVWDGQQAEIFVDGTSRGAVAVPGSATNWDDYELALGNELGLPAGEQRAWRGQIYLLAIYRRALSAGEIGQLHDMGPAS